MLFVLQVYSRLWVLLVFVPTKRISQRESFMWQRIMCCLATDRAFQKWQWQYVLLSFFGVIVFVRDLDVNMFIMPVLCVFLMDVLCVFQLSLIQRIVIVMIRLTLLQMLLGITLEKPCCYSSLLYSWTWFNQRYFDHQSFMALKCIPLCLTLCYLLFLKFHRFTHTSRWYM